MGRPISGQGNHMRRILAAVALLRLSAYSFNVAAFSWWAAGGSPVKNPAYFEQWGTGAFVVACASLLGVLVTIFRSSR